MTLIGSMFSGYGGLDLAAEAVFGGRTVWHAEVEAAPSRVLAHHWPGVPNLGDVTAVNWAAVPPVDVLCGGFPCQDVSDAGAKAGLQSGTRSGLWGHMLSAIAVLRPGLVVIENVRGLLSAEAGGRLTDDGSGCGALEPGGAEVGDNARRPVLRAAGAVLGDLASVGYDAVWTTVRASDVGAPHHRLRVIIAAFPADADGVGCGEGSGQSVAGWSAFAAAVGGVVSATDAASSGQLGVDDRAGSGASRRERERVARGSDRGRADVDLLPTSTTSQRGDCPAERDRRSPDLGAVTVHFPTPAASDATGGGANPASRQGHALQVIDAVLDDDLWGKYGPAIRLWENTFGPSAPAPTEPNRNGRPRLSARFVEWMMGLPAGHVTDVPGLSRRDVLKMLGNGVVPQQVAHALRFLLAIVAAEALGVAS